MLKRILVAVVCIPLIFVVFFVLPSIWVPIMISVLSMLAVHEVLWSTGFVKNIGISTFSILLSGVIPFWVYIGEGMRPALCGIFTYFVLIFIVAISSHYSVTMEKMGGAFFFSVLIPYFLSSFTRLHELELGSYLILLPLVVAFTSDAFALFAGMAFGKHKLNERVSPKKTWEGAIGGWFFGCVLSFGFAYAFLINGSEHLLFYVFASLTLPIVAQIGDLSFSLIKRNYGAKDFGSLIPGHGGVLDRVDSLLFCLIYFAAMVVVLI